MKRVFIAHGWDGYPEEGWFPWLKKELETKGFEVHIPQLPDPGKPRMASWVSKLAEVVGQAEENTFLSVTAWDVKQFSDIWKDWRLTKRPAGQCLWLVLPLN